MEPKGRERKWRGVANAFLPPTLGIFFVGILIFRSDILQPGGNWMQKPDTGNVVTENHITLQFEAYSFTFLPLERVAVIYWHEGIKPWAWNTLCVLQAHSDKTYTCDFDFIKLKVPIGKKILVSFEVYGILMKENVIGSRLNNSIVTPDGQGCFYWKKIDLGNPCGQASP